MVLIVPYQFEPEFDDETVEVGSTRAGAGRFSVVSVKFVVIIRWDKSNLLSQCRIQRLLDMMLTTRSFTVFVDGQVARENVDGHYANVLLREVTLQP